MSDPAVEPFPGARDYPSTDAIGELLLHQVVTRPDARALQLADGESWTWRQLGAEVARIQAGLAARGIAQGDHVALMCENSLRMAAMLCALAGYGAVAVPLNTGLIGKGLQALLEHSDARLLVVDPALLERCEETGLLENLPCILTEAGEGERNWDEAFRHEGELVARGGGADLSMILYTSGTTGQPKGAMLSHASCLTAAWGSAAVMFEAAPGEVIYTALPLYHCAAQQLGLWTALLSGAELVLSPRFSASNFWRHMRTYDVKAFHFVGPLTSVLWKAPPSPDDRNHPVKIAVGGGPRIAWRDFEERFGITFVECYGMTETFGGCVTHRPWRGRSGSAGKALDYVDLKVIGEEGESLPAGRKGRAMLRARKPHAFFEGYYKRPDLTEAAFDDGWYRTGDLCTIDEDGYLTWHSRALDIIRRRGENVSAVEVEAIVQEHPDVADCGVVGVPSELGEEDVFAVIVPGAGRPDPEAIAAFLSERLPSFSVPRYFAFVDELPKTATRRVQRHLLRDFLACAYDRQAGAQQTR